jgi:hypothetical protein
MNKPNNWESIKPETGGEFSRPSAGAYVFGIIKDETTTSRSNNEMLVLSLDIAEGEFKKYFKDLSEKLNKDFFLKHYRVLTEASIPYLKGDITSIEKSNPGFVYNFSDGSLRGKLVGGMLREEEYLDKNGMVKTSLKIMYLCSAEKARSGELQTPSVKKLDLSFNPPVDTGDTKLPWD